MKKKYKGSLVFISICIICCLSLIFAYKKYENNSLKEAIVLKEGQLSINYSNSNSISQKKGKSSYSFSISNDSDEDAYYSISLSDIKNFSDDVTITLIHGDSTFNIKSTSKFEKTISSNNKLNKRETINYTIEVDNQSSKKIAFDIVISEDKTSNALFAKTILENNEIKTASTTIGTDAATSNEGLISEMDDNGTTYYFRGSVDNNYVEFAGKTWRIVRINGDSTVRIVLDENIETVHNYTSKTDDYSYSSSDIKTFLEEWYNLYLKPYSNYIAYEKFCNDTGIIDNSENSVAYQRIYTNNIPTFSCLGASVNSNIGLLTIDEVIFAGASTSASNTSYYLYKSDNTAFWTMSTAKSKLKIDYQFIIDSGKVTYETSPSLNRGVKPVINLKTSVDVTGSGTVNNPYEIKE